MKMKRLIHLIRYRFLLRLEEQCETSVVSEPVKVCTPGEAHKVNMMNMIILVNMMNGDFYKFGEYDGFMAIMMHAWRGTKGKYDDCHESSLQSVTFRFRNFSVSKLFHFWVVLDSVSKKFGIEKSIGFGIVKIWYRKKY